MAEVFTFDTGIRDYAINEYVARFNPADPGFVSGFNTMLKHLSAGQDELRETMRTRGGDAEAVVDAVARYCEYGVAEFDACFGNGATKGMFCGCSPFAPQPETNLPLWVVLCDYITDIIMRAIDFLPEDADTGGLRVDSAKTKALMDKYKVKYR